MYRIYTCWLTFTLCYSIRRNAPACCRQHLVSWWNWTCEALTPQKMRSHLEWNILRCNAWSFKSPAKKSWRQFASINTFYWRAMNMFCRIWLDSKSGTLTQLLRNFWRHLCSMVRTYKWFMRLDQAFEVIIWFVYHWGSFSILLILCGRFTC